MEDQVQIKVFFYMDENSNPEIRRIGVDKSVVTSFTYLKAKFRELFPILKEKNCSICWKDADNDTVTITSDDELMIALVETSTPIKMYIFCKADACVPEVDELLSAFSNVSGKIGDMHSGVICDNCDGPVIGFRYKCASCVDYDLCATCEAAGKHPQHCMLRVPSPNMPRDAIRGGFKRCRTFMRNVANPPRRQRGCPRRDQHNTNSNGWLKTLSTYMTEFADLTGDYNQKTEEAAKAQASTAPPAPTGEVPKLNMQNLMDVYTNFSKSLKTVLDDAAQPAQPTQSTQEEASAGPTEEVPKAETPVEGSSNVEKPATPNELPKEDGEKGDGDAKTTEAEAPGWTFVTSDQVAASPEVPPPKALGDNATWSSSSSRSSADGFQDLHKEFQHQLNLGSYPPLSAAHAVFNTMEPLPMPPMPPMQYEGKQAYTQQGQTTQTPQEPIQTPRVRHIPIQTSQPRIQTPQTPIHTPQVHHIPIQTTQFPIPVQVQQIPAFGQNQSMPMAPGQIPQPTDSTDFNLVSTPEARAVYTNLPPHVGQALQQMISMGYSNESNWLTQLLLIKDGNIPEVLDLLATGASHK